MNIYENIKILITIGEVVDKFLVNSIKIEKIKADGVDELMLNNDKIKKIIEEWSIGCDSEKLDIYTVSLLKVLRKQWECLDISLDCKESMEDRMNSSFMAQNLNTDRVYWKNKINELCGHTQELKQYGK